MRRAAPGTQVSAGRLRVDAARAIKKLREYQLTDRSAWVLEAIRAGVAAGATRIELRGDSNDIWLGWHGTPWDAALLPRLFDELVSPEVADDKQPVRLLAAAVNSALGMDPAYVDVYSITAAGRAHRVRYTPDVLAEPENALGDAPLRHVAVEEHEPPTAIMSGVLVHMRRKLGTDVVGYLFSGPPELEIAAASCQNIAVPLAIGDKLVLHRETSAKRDVVRIGLDDGLDGFVAITADAVPADGIFEVAERGVVLARYPLPVLGVDVKRALPVRVFVDAERLPTNASRSQVRRDVHPIATAERRITELMPKVIAELVARYRDGSTDVSVRARRAALQLLAANVGGHPVGWQHIMPLLAPLGDLPLVANAFGEPRTLKTSWTSQIYDGRKPLEAALAPWLHEVLWAAPDDDVRILLGTTTIDDAGMRRHLRAARQQLRAQQKFLEHSKRELVVQTSHVPRVRLSLDTPVPDSCIPDGVLAGVRGQVCVYSEGGSSAITLCVDERELERIEVTSPIAFDAVVDSSMLTPSERYRGVKRDDGFTKVYRAVEAAVVRAIETIASESPVLDVDRPLFHSALLLAKGLGFQQVGALAAAAGWRKAGGGYAGIEELRRQTWIGLVGDNETIAPLPGRMIVHASGPARTMLEQLFEKRVVFYHRATTAKPLAFDAIASELSGGGRTAALVIRTDGMDGVIALGPRSELRLHHYGVLLGERPYANALVPCVVVVDADAIAPNSRWNDMLDDAGLTQRSFGDWERLLVRAIARALLGETTPGFTLERVNVDDAAFAALAHVLLTRDPVEILGSELFERLVRYPLFATLGGDTLHSIRALVAANPQGLYYVGPDAQPLADFAPVVCSERSAGLIGRLGKCAVYSGIEELKRRQIRADYERRLAAHLARPMDTVELPADSVPVAFRGKLVRGQLGITTSKPEVHVFVEGRRFVTLHELPVGYPVIAAVELATAYCNDTFDGVPNLTIQEIVDDIQSAVPVLLAHIAATRSPLLGEPGPARRMLSAYLGTGKIANELRATLRRTAAFPTVQGELCSIEGAEDDDGATLFVASWLDEWFPPASGEKPTVHDRPVLRVARPADELNTIIGKLHMDEVTDVTTEVTRLQSGRRMARGLLPTPKLVGVTPELKRPLDALGDVAKRLGPGEIGFANSAKGSLLIHEQGQLVRTMDLDVMPAVQLAIESPHEVIDHPTMMRLAQDLALELVRTALPADPPMTVKANIAAAVFARRIPPAAIAGKPLFLRADGRWADWATVQRQIDELGDVWAVVGASPNQPLDPRRVVLVLDPTDIDRAVENGFPVINAEHDLLLDAKARANMARPAATSLELPSLDGVLALVELEGDGKKAPRGVVAVLAPASASRRRTYVHRAMHPFDPGEDVCRWPAVAVVDDARLTPDRTWSAPKSDEIWVAVSKEIRAASERALEQFDEAPSTALAKLRVTNHLCADVDALRAAPRSVIRGVLWLAESPLSHVTITVRHAGGMRSFLPPKGLAVGGALAVYTPDGLDEDAALEELVEIAHGRLVRMLTKYDLDDDMIAAHVARALIAGTVKPAEIGGVTFECFSPRPLEPRALASLLKRTDPVLLLRRVRPELGNVAFVDTGTVTAKLLRDHLDKRLSVEMEAPPKPAPAPPPAKPVAESRPAPKAATPAPPAEAPKAPKAAPHPLQPLADALAERITRLGITVQEVSIGGDDDPMFNANSGRLVIAGYNKRLRRIASELAAGSVLAAPAIDALAAHAVTLLNIARHDITDATELHLLGVLVS